METIFPLFPSFLLPQHGWVGLCEDLLVSSTGRASQGPLWCSGMPVVDAVVTLGHRGAWAGCQAASTLCPEWKNARPAQAWGNQLWVFAGGEGLSIRLSILAATLYIACLYWVRLRW